MEEKEINTHVHMQHTLHTTHYTSINARVRLIRPISEQLEEFMVPGEPFKQELARLKRDPAVKIAIPDITRQE
jgi:hypothetical protein